MANITINSHDLLGKLSIIKCSLAMVIDPKIKIAEKNKYLTIAYQTNEELIKLIKKISTNAQNTNC